MSRKVYGIKRANAPVELDAQKIKELVKCKNNPAYFIKTHIKVLHPIKGIIPFTLYDYQEDLINLFNTNRRVIVKSSRQSGKSTIVAAFLLWYCMFNEGKTVLCVSKDGDAAKEIINRVQQMYLDIPDYLKCGIADDDWNKHSAKFDNGSKIVSKATSPNAARGLSISLLYVDELAFVKPNMQKEFWTAIQPTLSTGGSCIITSTPNGDSDLYSEICRGAEFGLNDFAYMFIPWTAPPGRDEQFKKEQIALMGQRAWEQEFECKFITSAGGLFDDVTIQNIEEDLNKNPRETFDINDVKFYKKIDSRLTYLVAVDPATGTGLDNSVIQIIEFPTMIQVAEIADNTLDSTKVYAKVKNVCNYISSIGAAVYFSFENNGVGEGIASLYLVDEGEFNAILITGNAAHDTRKVRIGFFTDTRNKMKFALRLKKVIEGRTIKINSKDFLTECKRYIREGQVYRAQPGATDDRISAMMIVLRMIEMMSDFDERAFGLYYSFENVEEQNWKEAKAIEEDLMPLPLFG